jgi:hypothetical protein
MKNKGINPQKTSRSRSKEFPSLRGDVDCCSSRSRHPFFFASNRFKNHGRNQEIGQALQSQQWRREKLEELLHMGKKGAFYMSPRNLTIARYLLRIFWPRTTEILAQGDGHSSLLVRRFRFTRMFQPNLQPAVGLEPALCATRSN